MTRLRYPPCAIASHCAEDTIYKERIRLPRCTTHKFNPGETHPTVHIRHTVPSQSGFLNRPDRMNVRPKEPTARSPNYASVIRNNHFAAAWTCKIPFTKHLLRREKPGGVGCEDVGGELNQEQRKMSGPLNVGDLRGN